MLTDKEYVSAQYERAVTALNRLKFAYSDMNNYDCEDDVHNLLIKLEKVQGIFEELN